jgi:hypothetical protein
MLREELIQGFKFSQQIVYSSAINRLPDEITNVNNSIQTFNLYFSLAFIMTYSGLLS